MDTTDTATLDALPPPVATDGEGTLPTENTTTATHQCKWCGFTARDRSNLRVHERLHTGEKPFQCRYCDHRTRDRGNLKVHERTHTDERPFKCDQCDYTSRCSSNLKTHKRRHDKSKSFVCSSCSYATNSEAMYRSHMFVHTSPESDNLGTLMGETARTPAVDHVLDAPQPGSNGLSTDGTPSAMTDYLSPTGADGPNSPLRVLTAVTDSKVFKCRHCDHTSNDRSNIRVHERTHVPGGAGKPFKCPHCDYRASQRVHMVLHVRRRHGEDAVAALPSPSLMRSVICVPMPPPTVLPQPEVDDIDYEALVRAETATGGPMLITVTPRGATLGQYGGTFGSSGVNGLGVLPLLQSAPTNVMTV